MFVTSFDIGDVVVGPAGVSVEWNSYALVLEDVLVDHGLTPICFSSRSLLTHSVALILSDPLLGLITNFLIPL